MLFTGASLGVADAIGGWFEARRAAKRKPDPKMAVYNAILQANYLPPVRHRLTNAPGKTIRFPAR